MVGYLTFAFGNCPNYVVAMQLRGDIIFVNACFLPNRPFLFPQYLQPLDYQYAGLSYSHSQHITG